MPLVSKSLPIGLKVFFTQQDEHDLQEYLNLSRRNRLSTNARLELVHVARIRPTNVPLRVGLR